MATKSGAAPGLALWLALAGIVILADQVTKTLILGYFQLGDVRPVTDFFNLVRVHNSGAAFSFLAGASGWQRWFFVGLGVAASVFIVWMLKSHPTQKLFCFAVSMIMGGALGNVVDRLLHGYVVDFLQFRFAVGQVLFGSQQLDFPIGQFLPTHLNRTRALMEHAIEFAQMGGNIDITATGKGLHFHPTSVEAIRMALDAGVPVDQITLSSDSNGSMPIFDEKGNVVRLGVGDIQCLFDDWRLLVKAGLSLEDSLKIVTVNPAKRTGLFESKGSIEPGKDADLLLLGPDLNIDSVVAKGRLMVHKQKVMVKGTFDE